VVQPADPVLGHPVPGRRARRAVELHRHPGRADPDAEHVSDLYPFPNTIVTLLVTGAEVADWLERAAAIFRQITPGATDAPLHDENVPSFLFEAIPQLSYAIDLSQPARFDGQGRLVQPDADGSPAASRRPRRSPRRTSSCWSPTATAPDARDCRTRPSDPQVAFTDGARVQSIIAAHVQSRRRVGGPSRHWHFLPMPGTSVTIATGDAAGPHLPTSPPIGPQASLATPRALPTTGCTSDRLCLRAEAQMYDAILFDLDGTLIDTESIALVTGMAAFAAHGHDGGRGVHAWPGRQGRAHGRPDHPRALPGVDLDAVNLHWRKGFNDGVDSGLR
jgi:hypothetical protein